MRAASSVHHRSPAASSLTCSPVACLALAVGLLATAACGGSDPGEGAFGGGGSAGTSTSSSSSTVTTSTSSQASGGGDGGGGDGGSDGGAGPGGGSSDGGGGAASAQGGGGSSSEGGGGGAGPATCDGGCAPSEDAEADCDEDGDPNATDCQPCDPLVFAGQEEVFDVAYDGFDGAEPSFDYDCDGELEAEYPYEADGCEGFNGNSCPDGETIYAGDTTPVCGESQIVEDCQITGVVIGQCSADGPASTMLVRCR